MLCWQGPGPACKYQGLSHFTLACTVLPSPISSANRQRPPSSTPRRTPSRWKLNRHRAGKGGAHSARVRQSSDAGSGNVASARPAVRPASAFSCALWLPVLVHGRAALLRLIVTSASPGTTLHCASLTHTACSTSFPARAADGHPPPGLAAAPRRAPLAPCRHPPTVLRVLPKK